MKNIVKKMKYFLNETNIKMFIKSLTTNIKVNHVSIVDCVSSFNFN